MGLGMTGKCAYTTVIGNAAVARNRASYRMIALPFTMSPEVPLEITVEETRDLLATPSAGVLLIDVREPHEFALCKIEGAIEIPMRRIPENLPELPRDKHLLIHCHHGGRSLRLTQWLRAQGLARVSNVAGGIDAWAERIEPGMARY
jgi:rhodanese-related sulfurtransferase